MNKMLLSTFIVKTNKWWKWLYSFLPVDEKIMTTLFLLWILSINDVLILSLFLAMYFTILGKIFWPSILIIFYYLVNPIQDGLFRNCSRMGGVFLPTPSLKSVAHILQWWNLAQLYLTKERPKKCINHVKQPWVLLASTFFHKKSANFATSRNTGIDWSLIYKL